MGQRSVARIATAGSEPTSIYKSSGNAITKNQCDCRFQCDEPLINVITAYSRPTVVPLLFAMACSRLGADFKSQNGRF